MSSLSAQECSSDHTRTSLVRLSNGHGSAVRPARERGQSIVEFGLVALLFALLISGMFDFGVLLNARLSISSMSRILARAAAADATLDELDALAAQQDAIPGVTTDTFSQYCCGWVVPISPTNPVPSNDAITFSVTYYDEVTGAVKPHDSRIAGDRVAVVVTAKGAEVFTPLVRPAFGCNDGAAQHCWVPISVQTTMRLEGKYSTP